MLKDLKLKGFTLVEMIIVVVILGVLIGVGINYLSTINADKYNSENCVNRIHGPLSQWVYYAATSKMLSWDIAPLSYLIQKEQNSGYTLRYTDESGEQIYQTGLLSEIDTCQKGEKYKVRFSSDFDKILMMPSLSPRGNQNGFEIQDFDGNLAATGTIRLKFCSPTSDSICYDFWEIVFDVRTAMIKKRFCKLYYPQDNNDPQKHKRCRQRSTGE